MENNNNFSISKMWDMGGKMLKYFQSDEVLFYS